MSSHNTPKTLIISQDHYFVKNNLDYIHNIKITIQNSISSHENKKALSPSYHKNIFDRRLM